MKAETIIYLCAAGLLSFATRTILANPATPAQITAQQKELVVLLSKASPNSLHSNSAVASQGEKDFSPYLAKSENERLVELLRDPEVAKVVTCEQALAAVKQRQLDNSLPGFQYNALMDLVNRRWPQDAAVIAFYQEALATRGEVAMSDLWSPLPGIWDDSLLEPVIRVIEENASAAKSSYGAATPKQIPWMVIYTALAVLDRHYSVWATNRSIARRLSKATLVMFPSLTNASSLGPRPGDEMWCNAVQMLANTHDSAMIAVLRPFLKDKVVAGDGSIWSGKDRTPLRACDKAAMAIKQLLGDNNFADGGFLFSGVGIRNVHAAYPKWDEWDQKIAVLQKRLDALPEK